MFKRAFLALAVILMLALPRVASAGKIGGALARYSIGGAGIGALLGAAAATVPYLTSKNGYDYLTGAGAGAVAGVGVGFIFGVIDLSTWTAGDEDEARVKGWQSLYAFQRGNATGVGYTAVF